MVLLLLRRGLTCLLFIVINISIAGAEQGSDYISLETRVLSEKFDVSGSGSPHVLVTGGAGYIGSHTVLMLLQEGYEVTVVDSLVNSNPESLNRVANLTGARDKLHFFAFDLRERSSLQFLLKHLAAKQYPFSACLHFAGLKAVGESVSFPLKYYDANVGSTLVLLQELEAFGVSRIIFSSSATVYGQAEVPISETAPIGQGITNPYGKTKYMIEEVLADFFRSVQTSSQKWGVVSLRYFNPVGNHPSGEIGEDPAGPPNNLMPYVAQVAVGRRPYLSVFGDDYETEDGTGVRDYIHVMDLAEGHLAALKMLERADEDVLEVYNLGTGYGVSVKGMVSAMETACGCEVRYVVAPRRPGDLSVLYASTEKAKRDLNWVATRSLQDMCSDLWRWQSKNPKGYPPDAQFSGGHQFSEEVAACESNSN